MPVPPDHPGVLRIKHNWNVGSDLSVGTTLHFTYTGTAPSNAVCATIAADCYALAVTNLVPLLCDDNYLTGVDVTDLTSPSSGNGVHVASQVGTRAGLPLPAATCVLINYGLDRRYRGGHPRSYVPAFTVNDIDTEQSWEGGSLTAFIPAWTDFIESAVGSMWAGGGTPTNVNVSYFDRFTAVQNPITLRWRNVPKVRTTPVVDTVATISANPAPCFQTRRGLIP